MSQRPLAESSAFGHQMWTEDETYKIADTLARKLSRDATASRAGVGNTRFTYIESWNVVQLANSIFGFNGWRCSVVELVTDFIDEERGRFSVGVTAVVRVTLKDGTSHEDVGYGTAELPKKGSAIEKAKKEAVSDGRKRALRLFGDALGNCLYDKEHLKRLATSNSAAGEDFLNDKQYPQGTTPTTKQTRVSSPSITPLTPMVSNVQEPPPEKKSIPKSVSPTPPPEVGSTEARPDQQHHSQQSSPNKVSAAPKVVRSKPYPQKPIYNDPIPEDTPVTAPKILPLTPQAMPRTESETEDVKTSIKTYDEITPESGAADTFPTHDPDGDSGDVEEEAFEGSKQSLPQTDPTQFDP